MVRLCTRLVWFLLWLIVSATVAIAELRLSMKPDMITAESSSALLIEASSLRVDLTVVYPDAQAALPDGDNALDVILGKAPSYDMSTAKRTVATHFSLGLLDTETNTVTAQKTEQALKSHPDLFEIVDGITQQSWIGSAADGPPLGPSPEIVFVIELDLPTAHLVKGALEKRANVLMGDPAAKLALPAFHPEAISWIQTALDASRIQETQVAGGGRYAVQKVTPSTKTVLGWLFQAMIDLSARPNAGAAAKALDGCQLREKSIVTQLTPEGLNPEDKTIEAFYLSLIADPKSFSSLRFKDFKTQLKYAKLGKDGSYTGGFARLVSWVGGEGLTNTLSAITDPLGGLKDFPDYRTALLNGRIDPAIPDIYLCSGQLRSNGTPQMSGSIYERKLGYRAATELLGQRAQQSEAKTIAPKFFSAAEAVTSLIGVGFVDPLELHGGDAYTKIAALADDAYVDEACAGIKNTDNLLPGPMAREILRRINWELYHNVNLPEIAYLRGLKRYDQPFTMHDPVTGKTLRPDLHPMFRFFDGTSLPFDLRMVLAEQGYIEKHLPSMLDLNSETGKTVAEELNRAQSALFCLNLEKFLTGQRDKDHRAILNATWNFLQEAIESGIIAKADARFSNYWWRVATGTAMVMALHGRSKEEFLKYLRLLIESVPPTAPGAARNLLTPHQVERLTAALSATLKPLGPKTGTLRRGTEILLSETFDDTSFWTCENGRAFQEPLNLPGNPASRLRAIIDTGGHVLALAFELGPDGALDDGAMPNVDNAGTCYALTAKRARFEAMVSELDLPGSQSYWSPQTPLIVFDRALLMRETLGRLAPFISTAEFANAPRTGVDRVMTMIERAHERNAVLQRRLTLLDILEDRKSSLAVLKLDTGQFDDAIASLATLRPEADGSLGEKGDRSIYSDAYGVDGNEEFVTEMEPKLATLFRDFEADWLAGRDNQSPVNIATGRFHQHSFFLTPRVDLLQKEPGLSDMLLSGLDLPGRVGISLTQTRERLDGIKEYDGELVLRLPSLRSVASKGATGVCDVIMSDVAQEGEAPQPTTPACADVSVLGTSTDIAEPELIPLGAIAKKLKGKDGCDPVADADCELIRVLPKDSDTRSTLVTTMKNAIRRIGIPGFVEFTPISLNFGQDDSLSDISITGRLSVATIALGEIEVAARTDGVWQNFGENFIAAASKAIDLELDTALAKKTRFLASLRLPKGQVAFDKALVRFGPALDASGNPEVALALNWKRGTLGLRAIYALQARLPDDKNWTEPVEVRAGVELTLGSKGTETRRIVFETTGKKEVMERIAQLPVFAAIAEETVGTISVSPVVKGGDLFLRLGFQAEVKGCPLETAISVNITDLGGAEKALEDAAKALVADGVACAAKPLSSELNAFLESKRIELLGVPFIVTAGEDIVAEAIEKNVPLVFTLADAAVGDNGPLGACPEIGAKRAVSGIKLKADPLKLDFRDMQEEDEKLLGGMVGCRIKTLVPDPLKPHFELRDVAVGHDLLAADIVLNDLPFLGTVALPRQNFSRLDVDVGELLKEALGKAASRELQKEIEDQIGEDGVDVAGVGRVKLTKDSLVLNLFDASPNLEAGIAIRAYDIEIKGKLELDLGRGLDALRIQIDEAAALEGALQGVLGKLLSFVPQETISIENPRFGRLDDLGQEWGLVFGLKAEVPIEPGLIVGASRITVSESGVRLGEKITGGISVPIYLGPVALSKVLISLYTGENGRKSGLEIGADITALEPQLAHLIKLRALLDLSEIDKPKFTAKGDLIVLSAVEIFRSKGVMDLSRALVTLDAETTDAIRDVLDFDLDLDIDGGNQRFLSKSKLAVLGVDLERTDLAFCVRECDDGTGREHIADLRIYKRLLIGGGTMHAVTDLDLGDPTLGAQLKLDLFGWSPGHARFDADLNRVRAGLRFLGIDLQAVTPSVKTMTPQLLIDMLKSLFDISLEDLLKIKPDNISVSVMFGDGSTQSVHDGSSAEGESSSQPSDGTGAKIPDQGTRSGGGQQDDKVSPPPEGDGTSAPTQTPWGRTVTANICEKVFGTPGRNELQDDLDARFYIHSVYRKEMIKPAFRWPIRHPDEAWGWWRLYPKESALALCDSGRNNSFEMQRAVVGTDRGYLAWRRCDPDMPPRYLRRKVENFDPKAKREKGIEGVVNLSTHLACGFVDGRQVSVWGDWFFDARNSDALKYIIAPNCPSGKRMAQIAAQAPEVARVCGDGLLNIPAANIGNAFDVPDVLDADTLYRLQVTHIRPRVEGAPSPRQFVQEAAQVFPDIQIKDATYSVTLWHEKAQDTTPLRWHFLMRRPLKDGANEVVPLVLPEGDPLIAFRNKPAVMSLILELWLEEGRRPVVLFQQKDAEFLVLGAERSPHESHRWIWQGDANAPISQRTIHFPIRLPVAGTNTELPWGKGPQKDIILDGMWEEVSRLPAEVESWTLQLGFNPKTRAQNFAFVEDKDSTDKIVHLLLNAVPRKTPMLAQLWNASRQPEPGPTPNADRRRCTTWRGIAEALAAHQFPQRNADYMVDFVELALTNPERFNQIHDAPRILPEPLVTLPNDTCPEP